MGIGFDDACIHRSLRSGLNRKAQTNGRHLSSLTSRALIFVLLGYYFGRLPCLQNEGMLKNEIDRQTKPADAAHLARETALQPREALDEKLKNVHTVLGAAGLADKAMAETPPSSAVTAALKILDS